MYVALQSLLSGMDSYLSWNARGLNVPNKKREVKFLCSKERVGLIGLLETKVKSNKLEQITIRLFVGWDFVSNLECHYNGKRWITQKPDYFEAITCEVQCIPLKLSVDLTYVYAFNTREEKKDIWDNLINHSKRCSNPWMVLSDFNSILKTDDRMGRIQ